MLLAQKTLAPSEKRRYEIDYSDYLLEGRKLTAFTVSLPVGTNATVASISRSVDEESGIFFIVAAAVSETFTATVQATLTDTEVVIDTVSFKVS